MKTILNKFQTMSYYENRFFHLFFLHHAKTKPNRIASYVMSNGSEVLSNTYPLNGISGVYVVNDQMSNDVCVVYVNDKIAFSNRVYDVVNKKWSIFGTADSSFSNINVKNP